MIQRGMIGKRVVVSVEFFDSNCCVEGMEIVRINRQRRNGSWANRMKECESTKVQENRNTSSAVVGLIERNRGRKPRKERTKENRKEGDLIVLLKAVIVQAVVSGSGMAGALFWLDIDY